MAYRPTHTRTISSYTSLLAQYSAPTCGTKHSTWPACRSSPNGSSSRDWMLSSTVHHTINTHLHKHTSTHPPTHKHAQQGQGNSRVWAVKAGVKSTPRTLHEIFPSASMLGWNMRVVKRMLGARKGYSGGSAMCSWKVPPWKGVFAYSICQRRPLPYPSFPLPPSSFSTSYSSQNQLTGP